MEVCQSCFWLSSCFRAGEEEQQAQSKKGLKKQQKEAEKAAKKAEKQAKLVRRHKPCRCSAHHCRVEGLLLFCNSCSYKSVYMLKHWAVLHPENVSPIF